MTEPRRAPRIFEPEYYRRLHDIEQRHWWSRGMRRAMTALLRRPLAAAGPLRVLDVGCGTGVLLDHVRRWPLAGPPVGLDLSLDALGWARARGAGALVLGDASALPFRSSAFDLVLHVDTIQHLSPADAERSLAEARRVLRPGGTLYLRTNSRLGHAPLVGVDPERYRRYDVATATALAERNGLELVRAGYLNALPGAWAALVERVRPPRASPETGPPLAIHPYRRGLGWLDRLLGLVLAGEAALIGRGVDLPFGHSTVVMARRPLDRPHAGS